MALVTVSSYRDPIDAELAKSLLESVGIRAVILDQHLVSIQWLYSYAIGGVKLAVDDQDLQAAQEVLREDRRADLASIAENQSPVADGDVCPRYASTDVRPSRLQRIAAAGSLATGLPLIAWRRRWICRSCGRSWKPHPSANTQPSEHTLRAEQLVHERRFYPILPALIAGLLGLAVLAYVQAKIRHP